MRELLRQRKEEKKIIRTSTVHTSVVFKLQTQAVPLRAILGRMMKFRNVISVQGKLCQCGIVGTSGHWGGETGSIFSKHHLA